MFLSCPYLVLFFIFHIMTSQYLKMSDIVYHYWCTFRYVRFRCFVDQWDEWVKTSYAGTVDSLMYWIRVSIDHYHYQIRAKNVECEDRLVYRTFFFTWRERRFKCALKKSKIQIQSEQIIPRKKISGRDKNCKKNHCTHAEQ